jgi:hypothetical protein
VLFFQSAKIFFTKYVYLSQKPMISFLKYRKTSFNIQQFNIFVLCFKNTSNQILKMKIRNLFFTMLAVTMLATSCQPAKHNVLTAQEKAEGWILLFDGETLNGWRSYNQPSIAYDFWSVVDGTLFASGGGGDEFGYLVTDREFENFILVWDWKISPGGNSGVLYHVWEHPRFPVPYITGPEYQMIDDHGFAEHNDDYILEDWQKTAADYAMFVPNPSIYTSGLINPPMQWNTSKIVFDNGHVEHWINGEKVVEFEAYSEKWFELRNSGKWEMAPEYGLPTRGVVTLQDHGDPVWFRNIKIKELPRQTREIVLFNGVDLHGWEVFGDPDEWFVENGYLICQSSNLGQYGYLATREYYDDFDLTLEFLQEADGNSGVFFRSVITPPANITGWQAEVAPRGHGTGGIFESGGRGWIAQITEEQEEILKEGEWNTMRVRVQGGNVTTWLNGHEMVNIVDDEIIARAQGRIALQIHAGGGIRVKWRNIRLTTL